MIERRKVADLIRMPANDCLDIHTGNQGVEDMTITYENWLPQILENDFIDSAGEYAWIIASLHLHGQKEPVQIMTLQDGTEIFWHGMHRLAAAYLLKWDELDVTVHHVSN